jgi:moderate conductance mechanosensitive channel
VTAGLTVLLQAVPDTLGRLMAALDIDLALLFDRGVAVLAILVLAWLSRRLLRVLTNRLRHIADDEDPTTLSAAGQRAHTLAGIAHNIGSILIWLGAGLMVLDQFIAIGPLLAGVGVVGLAVSFGAQSLVKDVISGFFILLENQFGMGDVVAINGVAGKVERMTLRVVMLRDLEGVMHVIPNGTISVVSNRTRGFSRSVLDIGVAYEEDIDRVIAVLRDLELEFHADPAWQQAFIDKPEVLGVQALADSSVNVRVLFTTHPGRQWEVAREFRRRVKNRFDAEGITIPFPQRTIHLGSAAELAAAIGGGSRTDRGR